MKVLNFTLLKSATALAKSLSRTRLACFTTQQAKNSTNKLTKMNIVPIEALSDNYMYLLVDVASGECAAVDPAEPKKVLEQVKNLNLKLTQVLTTHHHWLTFFFLNAKSYFYCI
jgi:hypothetical protein